MARVVGGLLAGPSGREGTAKADEAMDRADGRVVDTAGGSRCECRITESKFGAAWRHSGFQNRKYY